MSAETMADLLYHAPTLRLAVLLGLLGLLAGWEALAPRRPLVQPRCRRWVANIGIILIGTAVLRLALPVATVGLAVLAQQRGWGLLPILDLPSWAAILTTLLLLDLALYAQHVATHAVPVLWRLHRVHHTDLDIDVTTGLRFHPAEILLSLFYKGAVIVVLGADHVGVVMFEMMLNGGSLFSHSNVRLPAAVDRLVRRVWVTPDMHRVHHSVLPMETNSNYGTCLSLWDRLFGTYRAQPQAGHDAMQLGLAVFRAPAEQGLWPLLVQPLRRERSAAIATAASDAR